MKKAYEKPVISLESFQLSSNIAGECTNVLSTEQVNDYKLIGGFADAECQYEVGCYHVTTDNGNLMS